MTGTHALLAIVALAGIDLIGIIFLAAIGRIVPDVLPTILTTIVAAAVGGGAVKGADILADRRADELRKAWKGNTR